MKKVSKAAQVRAAVREGLAPAEISKKLKVPLSTVYTTRWKMKATKKHKKVPLAIDETKVKVNPKMIPVITKKAMVNPYLEDVMEVRRQIDDLLIIEAYLRTRADQVTQNGDR